MEKTQTGWRRGLPIDPLPVLLDHPNPAIVYFTRRDLLGEGDAGVDRLWDLPAAQSLVRRQQADGAWKYPGAKPHIRSQEDYNLLETYRSLGEMVEKHAFDRRHPAICCAAGYIFSRQTDEGDFRGIYGSQYCPTYSAGILELLIKAGYAHDSRVERGLDWLLGMRQDDGGWAIPLRTVNVSFRDSLEIDQTLQPDRSRPFSHLVTGMALRAFADHPETSANKVVHRAGHLLASRFFQRDKYPDRSDKRFWSGVTFPFWFTDVISALDSLSRLGLDPDDPQIAPALAWLTAKQAEDGLFDLRLPKGKDKDLRAWIGLAVSRVFARFFARPAADRPGFESIDDV